MNTILDLIANWEGTDSHEEAFDFCDQLCEIYQNGNELLRSAIRRAVTSKPSVRECLLFNTAFEVGPGGFLVEAARRAKESGDEEGSLRRALLAISITDGFDDSRDTLMWLADQWRESEQQGVDPTALYEEIGNLSSREAIHSIGGPTAGMILQMLNPRRRDQLKWS